MKESSYKDSIRLPNTGFAMKANLPAREPGILASWDAGDIYAAIRESRRGRETFILHDGPPYANGSVHLGTALNKILKDFVVKSHTMLGYDCPFVPGWDCHGMPIEHRVASGSSGAAGAAGRSEIRAKCREYAERHVGIQREEFRRLGIFGDWGHPYLTMSRSYEAGILEAFADLVEKGYVYQGLRPISWCSSCHTALADAEVEYALRRSPSIWVAFEQDDPAAWQARGVPAGTEVVIWTTTPWTLPANRAVALNPAEEYTIVGHGQRRFLVALRRSSDFASMLGGGSVVEGAPRFRGSDLEGLWLSHPVDPAARSLVITAEHVTMDDGTGCVHTAPGHGTDDFAAGMRYGLEVASPVDPSGVFTEAAGRYAGMHVHQADPVIMEDLRASGRLVASGSIEHSYQHCWRCHRPLIYRATSQFFLDLSHEGLKDRVLSAVDGMGWHPGWGYDRMKNMMSARPDWCLSRQRAWGVALPALVCRSCGEAFLDAAMARAAAGMVAERGSDAWFETDPLDLAALAGRPAVCAGCGSKDFDRVDDILDVWFDSSLSHRNVLTPEYGLSRPASVYLEATDQHRGWFGVSLITSTALGLGIPSRNIVTHGLVLDPQGKKMSKSLGNVVSPLEVIETYGADILRLWFASVDYTADFRAEKSVLDDMREAYRKLRNTVRFLLGNLTGEERAEDFRPCFSGLERFMYLRFRKAAAECVDAYRSFEFHRVFRELRNLATIELSGLFLDARKDRLYCDAPEGPVASGTRMLLGWMATGFLELLAPILPFTSEEGWRELPPGLAGVGSVHMAMLPDEPLSEAEEAELAGWDRYLEYRRIALKSLEDARAAGLIGSSLEAHVRLSVPSDALDSANGEPWADFLIVSTVETVPSPDGEVSAEVSRTQNGKCERCWRHMPEVEASPERLCARCAAVVGVGGETVES